MWRPDLLLEQSDCGTVEPVICEINARFPYNAWLLVASLAKSLQDGLKLDKVKVRTTSDYSVSCLFSFGRSKSGRDIHLT